MQIELVPCLSDNYAYVVSCDRTGARAVVDPSEAGPVLAALGGRAVTAIWCTHHHFDHVGGNGELVEKLAPGEICAHTSDRGRVPGQTRGLEEGERFALGAIEVSILHVPGHTLGAVAYALHDAATGARAVFTGDTMFVAGCGRLFEGTAEQMFSSLAKIAALDPATRVYCGHEYTAANVRFARTVEPDNAELAALERSAAAARAAHAPTIPSTISGERAFNPFVRARDARELAERRAAKDAFR